MKNHEYIRQLPVKELAKLLVHETQLDDSDGWEDEVCLRTYYENEVSDELYDSYNDALQSMMDWLNADRKES